MEKSNFVVTRMRETLAQTLLVKIQHKDVIPTHTVFFLHGLGDSADGWVPGVYEIIGKMRPEISQRIRWVLPTATNQPVTLYAGVSANSWYNITDLADTHQECEGIDESGDRIECLIDEQVTEGVPKENMFLCGFSQGAALSLFHGLSRNYSLNGIAGLSGYIPRAIHPSKPFKSSRESLNTPCILFHGRSDPIVVPDFGSKTRDALSQNRNIELHWYDMAHSSCDEEISDLSLWIEILISAKSTRDEIMKSLSSSQNVKRAMKLFGLKHVTEKVEIVDAVLKEFQRSC